jgi:hypothetical protein
MFMDHLVGRPYGPQKLVVMPFASSAHGVQQKKAVEQSDLCAAQAYCNLRDVKVYISEVFRQATVLLRAQLPKFVVSQSNLSHAGMFHTRTVL